MGAWFDGRINLYIYHLSILIHLKVVNLLYLKQRFNNCLFEVSFCMYNFFIIYNLFYQSFYIFQFTIVARSILTYIKNQLNTVKSFT